jgi:hypothetical protein
LEDPDAFFTALGEEAAVHEADLVAALLAQDAEGGEGYFVAVGRVESAKARAREAIEREWLRPPAPEAEDDDPDDALTRDDVLRHLGLAELLRRDLVSAGVDDVTARRLVEEAEGDGAWWLAARGRALDLVDGPETRAALAALTFPSESEA